MPIPESAATLPRAEFPVDEPLPTYGDPHGVKAGRIADLEPGDWLLFYATLSLRPHGWGGPDEASAP